MEKPTLLTFLILILFLDLAKCAANFSTLIMIDVEPTTKDHMDFFAYLDRSKDVSVIYLKKPSRLYHSVQFIADAVYEELLMERMRHYGLSNAYVNRDIQGASMEQSFRNYTNETDDFDFVNYHSYDDICLWLKELTRLYPNRTELKQIGNSSLGKPIYSFIIRNNKQKHFSKVVIEAGVHGNEWLPIAFVTYLIETLISLETADKSFKKIAETIEWYLIPVVNPDGFEYSFQTDRFWKKNRRSIKNSTAIGVNLDRNFNYTWGVHGSSDIPSNENFCGWTVFSEPETRALAHYVNGLSRHLLCYLSFHAYGQNIVVPYGDTVNHDEEYMHAHNIAEKAAHEIKRIHNTKYFVGSNYDANGMRISGNSASWVKKQYNTRCAYTFQMQDTGKLGYFIPSRSIVPASDEMITAIRTLLENIPRPRLRLEYFSSSPECASQVSVLFVCIVLLLLK